MKFLKDYMIDCLHVIETLRLSPVKQYYKYLNIIANNKSSLKSKRSNDTNYIRLITLILTINKKFSSDVQIENM